MPSSWRFHRKTNSDKLSPETERETTKLKPESGRETTTEPSFENEDKEAEREPIQVEKEKIAEDRPELEPAQSTQEGRKAKQVEERAARLRLYRRNDVRRFATWILRGHEEIRPQRNPESGEYDYSGIGFDHGDIGPLLNELESHNILQRTIVDTTPTCPKCAHSNFHVVYLCPFSQHSTLELGTMIEHYPCGHTDFEVNFRSGNDFVCPKCRRVLKMIGTDYRKIERSYRCISCRKHFGMPKLQFLCRTCGKANSEDETAIEPIYGYRLNKELRSELVSYCSLEAKITELFKEYGFEVTAPRKLEGLSGVLHNFDFGAKKDSIEIVLDMVSSTGEVGPQDIVEFFAKVYDTKPAKALLIAMPRISTEAQRLGAMYGVEMIGAEEPDEIIERLTPMLGSKPSIVKQNAAILQRTLSRLEQAHSTAETEPTQRQATSTAEEESLTPKQIEQTLSELERKSSSTKEESPQELESPAETIRLARIKIAQLMEEAKQRI